VPQYRAKGAQQFAWIRPKEFAALAGTSGCFVYEFAKQEGQPQYRYFPVVGNNPVFTKEVIEKTLGDNEAWVVVRRDEEVVERLVVFDKTKSFEENAKVETTLAQTAEAALMVKAHKEGESTSRSMTYSEWQKSREKGTYGEPWILEVADEMVTCKYHGGKRWKTEMLRVEEGWTCYGNGCCTCKHLECKKTFCCVQ